jgi:NAD(P)-dependent dehydrogenase (short-subunit alcohol dehydrogenase family)
MDLSQFGLEDKVAIVTGGSRGIGKATSLAFAKAGANVVVASRKLADCEEVAGEIKSLGRRAIAVSAHVGRMDQLQPVIDRTVAEFGRIDVLVNNAGTNFFAPAIEMDEKGWDSVMNTNLKGLFFLSQAAARVMKEKGGGSIVNVASVSGLRAQVPTAHYSIAKAGVIMATKALAVEWAPFGIRVNCVAPGAIDTRLYDAIYSLMPPAEAERRKAEVAGRFPLKRVGQPREIADAILFFASNAGSYTTGQTLTVDGGALLV